MTKSKNGETDEGNRARGACEKNRDEFRDRSGAVDHLRGEGNGAARPGSHDASDPRASYPHSAVLDVRNAPPPPPRSSESAAGAPNVLIVLIDDMGFGQSGTFGGPLHMPTVDRLAQAGLRYNQFHTTAMCSPTRPRSSRAATTT